MYTFVRLAVCLFPLFLPQICDGQSQSLGAEQLREDVTYLASDELAGRAPGTNGSKKAAQYITNRFAEMGLQPLANEDWFKEFSLDHAGDAEDAVKGRNILAWIPGRGSLESEAVIVCAHYDHIGQCRSSAEQPEEDLIYNGASDNAAGVAAMLMVGRSLCTAKELNKSRRAVIFISFDAEERGLQGARYYVNHPMWPLEKTAAMINFDNIGRLRMGKVFAGDAETNPHMAEVIRDAAKRVGIIAETRTAGHGRSDHAIFLERQIPAVHFFTGANPDYHQVSDETERLNFEGCEKIAKIGWDTLRFAMVHPDLSYQKPNPAFDVSLALNVVRRLGVIPAQNAQDGQYPILQVVIPGSEADKAGLKPSDRIRSINGLKFNRVEDALTILPQLSIDEGLRLSILRESGTKEIFVPGSAFEPLLGPKSEKIENGKYEVVFRYQASPRVKNVFLAGEFNDWIPTVLPMSRTEGNQFETRIKLDRGTYEYKFVIDGTEWKSDPENMLKIGFYGNSVASVGQ